MMGDGTTHDVKVVPEWIDTLDIKEIEILCTDKGYNSELLREKIENIQTKADIAKKTNSKSNNEYID